MKLLGWSTVSEPAAVVAVLGLGIVSIHSPVPSCHARCHSLHLSAALPFSPAGEFAFWLGSGVDVLPYYGPVAARAVMHDNELWLHPSCLEGRGLPRSTLLDRVSERQLLLRDAPELSSATATAKQTCFNMRCPMHWPLATACFMPISASVLVLPKYSTDLPTCAPHYYGCTLLCRCPSPMWCLPATNPSQPTRRS